MDFSTLKNKTINKIVKSEDEIIFHTNDGSYKLCHWQDCCEHVRIEDVIGDLDDLLNSPILLAEEIESEDHPDDFDRNTYLDSCYLWTFYKLATIKGYVTIRWLGESNGYYSVSVHFEKISE